MANKTTITDIANLAGVSKATVSYYLNGKTYKMSETTANKIKEAIEKTGFTPNIAARSLNAKGSKLIGVIIGNITNAFANQTVKGIEEYANENGFLTIVASSEFKYINEKKYIDSMLAMGVDGFLIQPTKEFNTLLDDININKPIVLFDSAPIDKNAMYVKTNNYDITSKTLNELINKGYESFVLLTYEPYAMETRTERYTACVDVLGEKQIPYRTIIIKSDKEVQNLKDQLSPILDKNKNVCVFAFNHSLLQMAYVAMKKYISRIPEIGLIGFDHAAWCEYTSPSISLIDQPAYEEGKTACKILLDSLQNKDDIKTRIVLNSTYIERDSTSLVKK